jgi:uncharacterized membrane protein YphA (DoxX/SURF4 family)
MIPKDYAPITVRLAISFVVLWFGINQLVQPEDFMGYLPEFLLQSDYAKTAVILNGLFETMFGIALAIGFLVRPVALILSIHLFSIVLTLGYNDIAIRDFGLALVSLSIFIGGADKWCLDYRRKA